MDFATYLRAVGEEAPLVQCITNFVTVNDCANMILAAGGSPSMCQDPREVEEGVGRAKALYCNMGAIDKVESMLLAGREANRQGKPVILDPVAAGGTQLRRDCARELMAELHFAAIRGNASEIRFLAGEGSLGSGVDVSAVDAVTEENLPQAKAMAADLARRSGSVIAISGAIDVISDGRRTAVLRNGCATMARVTGSGCMLTALIAAFCGASPQKPFEATVAAMAAMGVAGELAEQRRLKNGTGNATFRTDLIDAVFNLTEQQLLEGIHYEMDQR